MGTARRFPGGIADAAGTRAALRDADGRLLAVALDAGTLLWRSTEPLAPLLLMPDEVIACTLGPQPACIALRWDGPQAGVPRWTSQPIGLPSPPDPDLRLAAEADERAGTFTVRWQGAARYRGGAAPGPAAREAATRGAQGAVLVDRDSGVVRPLPASRGAAPADLAADDPGVADPDPRALASTDLGTRRFELLLDEAPDGRVRTVLRARAAADGGTLWELPIDERRRAPARPPRP